MKFGKNLRDNTLKEWRYYAVDYKRLKKALKAVDSCDENKPPSMNDFFLILDEAQVRLSKFFHDRNLWAHEYTLTLQERVAELRKIMIQPSPLSPNDTVSVSESSSHTSLSDVENTDTADELGTPSRAYVENIHKIDNPSFQMMLGRTTSFYSKQEWLKQEYRRMGVSKEFEAYIYAKKSLVTFERELQFLSEFLEINHTAFVKILKKYDKRMSSNLKHSTLADVIKRLPFLQGDAFHTLKEVTSKLIDEVTALKPHLPEGWETRKVYTIGCFE
jgi:SPX domain protein involved in polyphosphate accumulation